MKNRVLENDVKRDIMTFLNLYSNKFFVWRQNNAGVFNAKKGKYIFHGLPGVADIIGLTKFGKFVAIEVKATGKKNNQSEAQKEFEKNIKEFGGYYFLVDSVEDLERQLKEANLI
jgi:hypothetical protein